MKKNTITVAIEYFFSLIVSILPVIFWLCLIYSFDEKIGASVTILAMIIHEFGHLSCIFLLTGKIRIPKGNFAGLRITENTMATYMQQLLLYASGASFNLIAIALMVIFHGWSHQYGIMFITINFATAISNLLPIDGYDGYKIILTLINCFNLGYGAYVFLEIISFIFTFLMSIVSLFLVYTFGNGYWIMGIFITATINKLSKWQKYQFSRK